MQPSYPRLRSDHQLFQRISPTKQISSSQIPSSKANTILTFQFLVGAILLSLFSPAAPAATIFTNRLLWEEALTGAITTDRFESDISTSHTITFDSGIKSIFVGTGTLASNAVVNRNFVTFVGPGDQRETRWDFPSPVTAFGFDFFFVASANVTGQFDDAADQTIPFTGSSGFLGVIGNRSFSAILLGSTSLTEADGINIADVSFHSAPIPEPGATLQLAVLLGFGFLYRTRRSTR